MLLRRIPNIDDVYYKFLRELDVIPSDAFMVFVFAPPNLRRNIGILGLLHKRMIGKCHPPFECAASVAVSALTGDCLVYVFGRSGVQGTEETDRVNT